MAKNQDDIVNAIVAAWAAKYQRDAKPVIDRIRELVEKGRSPNEAVEVALRETGFFAENERATYESAFNAAARGVGLDPLNVNVTSKLFVIETIKSLPWTADKLRLSDRIHGTNAQRLADIKKIVSEQMRVGTNFKRMARDLYDGYGYGGHIKPADLPKYLKELISASNDVMRYGKLPEAMKEFNRTLANAKIQIEVLSQGGAPTKMLKAAYKQLYNAALKLDAKALDNSIYVAINEKTRYNSERIARTEIAKAWGDGFYAKHLDDPDVIAFTWSLSSRHPHFDICDMHATADMFGLGPGVYPKNAMPPYPAHPHCTCRLRRILDGDLDGRILRLDIENTGAAFLRSLSRPKQMMLMGSDGYKKYFEAPTNTRPSWQNLVRGFLGYEDPATRLTKDDFKKE